MTVWSRKPADVAELCGRSVRGIASLDELGAQPVDAIINLAGAPIADRPWTRKRRLLLWESRVGLTEQLLKWLGTREQKPALMISGSAVGWYGDSGEREIDETSLPAKEDFASQLCNAWEETAQRAEALGVRVVLIRTGLVLSDRAGFLQRLLPPFQIRHGRADRQWQAVDAVGSHPDQIAAIDFLLNLNEAKGPYNVCAFTGAQSSVAKSLAGILHRPAFMPMPALALKVLLGELSVLLLGGQRARPERLQEAGFTFKYTELDIALQDLLGRH